MIIKRIFDNRCVYWTNDANFNKCYLKEMEKSLRSAIKAQGYLFLRDVLGQLGIYASRESCEIGWDFDHLTDNALYRFDRVEGTNDFVLTFDCYPILGFLKSEDEAGL